MKVRELIELLKEYPQDEIIHLTNGVGAGGPLDPDYIMWEVDENGPYAPRGFWEGFKFYRRQGPIKPALAISADW